MPSAGFEPPIPTIQRPPSWETSSVVWDKFNRNRNKRQKTRRQKATWLNFTHCAQRMHECRWLRIPCQLGQDTKQALIQIPARRLSIYYEWQTDTQGSGRFHKPQSSFHIQQSGLQKRVMRSNCDHSSVHLQPLAVWKWTTLTFQGDAMPPYEHPDTADIQLFSLLSSTH
jgi:hypothetical protein